MTESMDSIQPLLKLVYQDAINEQLRRDAVMYERFKPTPEQQERINEAKAEREKERKDLLDLLATATGTVKAVIELHSPTSYDNCEGCDFGGWEGDSAAWPCRTIDLIAEELRGKD